MGEDLKFNVNLFKVFLMPSYKLCLALYTEGNSEERKMILQHLKGRIKVFCNIPFNTPNYILNKIFGDVRGTLEHLSNRSRWKLEKHRLGDGEMSMEEERLDRSVRHIPLKLPELLRTLYEHYTNPRAMNMATR